MIKPLHAGTASLLTAIALTSGLVLHAAGFKVANPSPAWNEWGDYEDGKNLFFKTLKCSKCHRIRGQGEGSGPVLDGLVARDVSSVLRDIKEPSTTINPAFRGTEITYGNGVKVTGFAKGLGSRTVVVTEVSGRETKISSESITALRPLELSLMQPGHLDGLQDKQVRDLLTFLMHTPPKPRPVNSGKLAKRHQLPLKKPVQVVLVASKQDHGPGQHDYPKWQKDWTGFLSLVSTQVTVATAWEWPTEQQWSTADAVLFYYWHHDLNQTRLAQMDSFLARGKGIMIFHSATIHDQKPELLAERIGLAAQPGRMAYRHMPFDLKVVAPKGHAFFKGLPRSIPMLDEPYWPMAGDTNAIEVLATARVDNKDRPMMWTYRKGPGRVFASIAGHYSWTLDDPVFRTIAVRGLSWTLGSSGE